MGETFFIAFICVAMYCVVDVEFDLIIKWFGPHEMLALPNSENMNGP